LSINSPATKRALLWGGSGVASGCSPLPFDARRRLGFVF
jgi:hypothetical protein